MARRASADLRPVNAEQIVATPLLIDGRATRRGQFGLALGRDAQGMKVLQVDGLDTLKRTFGKLPITTVDAICPRPMNAHTHLDLSTYPHLRGDFAHFIAAMAKYRREHPQARGLAAASSGLGRLVSRAVAAVGDIVARDAVMVAELQRSPLAGVAYREVVCTEQAAAVPTLAALMQRLQAWRPMQRPDGPRVGLSPQSPYLVCKDLLRQMARLSITEQVPLQIHVAESPSELAFFQTGSGSLAQALSASGFRVPPSPASLGFQCDPALTPIRYLADIGFLDAAPTLVHCVNVTDEDIQIIAEHRCPVITCTRSNANLQCGVFPWKKFEQAGVSVALATDSVASAHDIEIWHELDASLACHGPGLDLATALEWLTVGASRALGLAAMSIEVGCRLDDLTLFSRRPLVA
ncbi:MAG: amidohydrolase family protein [Ideonella sp.]|nr:amidohydrolase family protein [Ideonella sp.]